MKVFKAVSNPILIVFAFILIAATGCQKDDIAPDDFGVFSSEDEQTVIMDGVIDSDIIEYWDNYIAAFPNTNQMIMKDCPGSSDDAANLETARKIRAAGIDIHLPAEAEIASGAVDLFLAGVNRTREAGSKIGVHSWANGNGDVATDYPVGHEEHQIYIDYFLEMGFSQADAEAFYYFTINAAPHDDIHWMTDEEIDKYQLLK